MLEQGPYEQKILQTCLIQGMPLPEKIKNAPELLMGLQMYFSAFVDLGTCRPVGFGVAPIPWTAIDEYCTRLGLDEDEREDMMYHVQTLDIAFCEHNKKKG